MRTSESQDYVVEELIEHCLTNKGKFIKTECWLYWLNPGLCGSSISSTQDCVVEELVEHKTVTLEYWFDPEQCSGSTSEYITVW